jgi:hypothetical protein
MILLTSFSSYCLLLSLSERTSKAAFIILILFSETGELFLSG